MRLPSCVLLAACLAMIAPSHAEEGKHFFSQSSEAKDGQTFGSIPTYFGTVDLVARTREYGWTSAGIVYRGTEITTASPYPSMTLEYLFHLPNEDVLVLSHNSMARGLPSSYYLVRIDRNGMSNLGNGNDFGTADGTFSVEQKGNSLSFDLGFEKGRRKSATYASGILNINFTSSIYAGQLPKSDCANVLNILVKCIEVESCKNIDFIESGLGGMSTNRYFARLSQNR